MLLACCLALAIGTQTPVKTWYGPQTATFRVQYSGNPYDPDENDVRVRFIDGKGKTVERIAYLDDGEWKATLVAENPGTYRPVLIRNGTPSVEPSEPEFVELTDPLPNGYLHVDRLLPTRFAWDSGKLYYPIGFNLAWQEKNAPPMLKQMQKMGEAGLNWTRIWADNRDGKNPWWPAEDAPQDQGQPDNLWAPALTRWETLVHGCEMNGLEFQMVLFNHGAFSTKTDAKWADNPWNKAKGGFLETPQSFFTDPEARRRAKMWLRYAVARYASSPQLMAWELFDQVEKTDLESDGKWKVAQDWGAEMAAYLRSIDPYGHMVTGTSQVDPGPWVDFYTGRMYESDLESWVGKVGLRDKPFFFVEFGPPSSPTTADLTPEEPVERVDRPLPGHGWIGEFDGVPEFESIEGRDMYATLQPRRTEGAVRRTPEGLFGRVLAFESIEGRDMYATSEPQRTKGAVRRTPEGLFGRVFAFESIEGRDMYATSEPQRTKRAAQRTPEGRFGRVLAFESIEGRDMYATSEPQRTKGAVQRTPEGSLEFSRGSPRDPGYGRPNEGTLKGCQNLPPDDPQHPSERAIVREGLYASILSGQSGAAQYWYWDRVDAQDMYDEFKAAAAVVRLSDRAAHIKALQVAAKATAADPPAGAGQPKVRAVGDLSWLVARVSLPQALSTEGVLLSGLSLTAGTYTCSIVDLRTGEVTTHEATIEGVAHTERLSLPSRDCVVIFRAKP